MGPTASIMLQEHAMATYVRSLVDVKLTRNNEIPNLLCLSLSLARSFVLLSLPPYYTPSLRTPRPFLSPLYPEPIHVSTHLLTINFISKYSLIDLNFNASP